MTQSDADAEEDIVRAVSSTESSRSSGNSLADTEAATLSKVDTIEAYQNEPGEEVDFVESDLEGVGGKEALKGAAADIQTDVTANVSQLSDTAAEVQAVIDGMAAGLPAAPAVNRTAAEAQDVVDGMAAAIPVVPAVEAVRTEPPKVMADTRWGSLQVLNPLLLPLGSPDAKAGPDGLQSADEAVVGDSAASTREAVGPGADADASGGSGGGESGHGSQTDGRPDRLGVLFLGDSVDRDTLLDVRPPAPAPGVRSPATWPHSPPRFLVVHMLFCSDTCPTRNCNMVSQNPAVPILAGTSAVIG